jgi:C4-dicarboxylate-specific signal transduction histidine kinase
MNAPPDMMWLDARPTVWPHANARLGLPADIESALGRTEAAMRVDSTPPMPGLAGALAAARACDDEAVLAHTLFRAATILRRSGAITDAYVLSLEAQPLLERRDDRWLATKVLKLRGRCCLDVRESGLALELLNAAAARFAKIDAVEAADCQSLIAEVHWLDGDAPLALETVACARRSLPAGADPRLSRRLWAREARLRLRCGDQAAATGARNAAAAQYLIASQDLPAAADLERSAASARELEAIETTALVGRASGDPRVLGEAVRLLARYARVSRSRRARGIAWRMSSELRRLAGKQDAAVACARRAVAVMRRLPGEPRLAAAHRFLGDLLEARGDLGGAYDAHLEATRREADDQRLMIAARARLLALDLEADEALRKSEQTLAYAQRLSNVGHLVASVNHELNQPIASIRMLADTALALIERNDLGPVHGLVQSMRKIGVRLGDVASKLAAFSAEAPRRPVAVRDAIEEATVLLRSRLAQHPCRLVVDVPDVRVMANEAHLVRVFANLVNNALDAMATQDDRLVHIRCSCSETGDAVGVTIDDNGPGLSVSVRERLFEPFFSTKAVGQGLGLGLALSRDVMREMGGDLVARDTGTGAQFELTLPRAGAVDDDKTGD